MKNACKNVWTDTGPGIAVSIGSREEGFGMGGTLRAPYGTIGARRGQKTSGRSGVLFGASKDRSVFRDKVRSLTFLPEWAKEERSTSIPWGPFTGTSGDEASQAAREKEAPAGDGALADLRRDVRDFSEAVDRIVASGSPPSCPVRMLSRTPHVLALLDNDAKTAINASKNGIFAAPHVFYRNHHNIVPDILKQIPAAMTDPIAILDSNIESYRNAGDVLFVLDIKDDTDATIVVPVMLNVWISYPDSAYVNMAKSAYAKEKFGVPCNGWIITQLKKNARYVNGRKMDTWLRAAGSNFPLGPSGKGLAAANIHGRRVLTEADLVKARENASA